MPIPSAGGGPASACMAAHNINGSQPLPLQRPLLAQPPPAQLTASAVVARSAAPLRSTTCSARQGAEKLIISKMLEQHSNRRTFPVDRHAGMAVAGVAADGRSVVSRAMGEVGPPARGLPAVCCS